MKKYFKKESAFVLAVAVSMSTVLSTACAKDAEPNTNTTAATTAAETSAVSTTVPAEVTADYRTDFYQAVNEEWLSKASIPATEYQTSEMNDIYLLVEKQLKEDLNAMCTGQIPAPGNIPGFDNFLKYYELNMDFAAREELGTTPMLPDLQRIDSLESMEQFTGTLSEWIQDCMPSPINYTTFVDFKQADTYTLYLGLCDPILPDRSYYDENKQRGEQLLAVYQDSITKMAVMAGKTESEAAAIASETLEYDQLLTSFMPSSVERNDYASQYNPKNYQEVAAVNKDMAEAAKKLVGQDVPQIIVTHKNSLEAISVVLSPENFQKMKSWMYAQTLMHYKNLLTESYRQIGNQLNMAMTGVDELTEKEKVATKTAINLYTDPVSVYYGQTYLGEKGKADVTGMTRDFIATYRERLEKNTWMGSSTKVNAIEKLDKMNIQIGYPETVQPIFEEFTVVTKEQGGTLVSNANELSRKKQAYLFRQYKKPVNRSEFVIPGFTVNAAYDPSSNTICIPAAFLQGAMYSSEQSDSANYGAIGMVIAHEISHAFDPNGSKFDAGGNMTDWWTEDDYKKFEELSQSMVEQFDGIPYADGKVDGTLTIGENVADLGGISCALSVANSKEGFDPQVFFKSYATIWRKKARPEAENMNLLSDPHSPAKLRVNVLLPNFEEFHKAFSIEPGDAMYRAPKKRVTIW